MKRIRIRTLMLLIVIAALIVGLAVEKRRSALILARMQAEQNLARMRADETARFLELELLRVQPEAKTKSAVPEAKPTTSSSP
jgi:hypothetical protein